MLSLYRWLLRLYPTAYRTEFGDEMLTVFLEAKSETWQKSSAARMAFCASEFGGVICGALAEHLRAVAGSGFFPLFGSRRFFMRSEFRFPKATAPLMAIILAVIVVAIEKAKAISAAVPHANPPVVPVLSVQFTIVPNASSGAAHRRDCGSAGVGRSLCAAPFWDTEILGIQGSRIARI